MLFETQAEREALVSLMLLARFSDKKLSISEEETFTEILANINWQDVISADSFVNENISKVRYALTSEESLTHFLNEYCAVFTSETSKNEALTKIHDILEADGLAEEEKALYLRIEEKIK